MPQAPALIEPSVKALDEAIEALEGATQAVEDALEACDFDPRELERCEERLFALRAMSAQARRADRKPAGAGAEIRRRSRRARGRAQTRSSASKARAPARASAYRVSAPRASSAARTPSARELETAVTAELPPLKLERAEFRVDLTTDEALARAERLRSRRVPGPAPIPARVRGR